MKNISKRNFSLFLVLLGFYSLFLSADKVDGVIDIPDNPDSKYSKLPIEQNMEDVDELVKSLDSDEDGFNNFDDICRFTHNPDQKDTDSDGIGDACDNCINIRNLNQTDTDRDKIGNACDFDFNNNGIIDEYDVERMMKIMGCKDYPNSSSECPKADLNHDGEANQKDIYYAKSILGKKPGPSGYHDYHPRQKQRIAMIGVPTFLLIGIIFFFYKMRKPSSNTSSSKTES